MMFKHSANAIEELVGEPRLSAEGQIKRARLAVQKMPAFKLDRLVVDRCENHTVSSPGSENASIIFYEPGSSPS